MPAALIESVEITMAAQYLVDEITMGRYSTGDKSTFGPDTSKHRDKEDKPMKKRTFLKMSSAALTGAALSQVSACKQADKAVAPVGGMAATRLKNWAGNLEYSTENVVYPESV